MTVRDFLLNIIQELPSRGVDNVNIYIYSLNKEEDLDNYRIIKISNDGANDAICILIEKE